MAFFPRRAKTFVVIVTYWNSVVQQSVAEAWSNSNFRTFRKKYGPYCYIGFPAPELESRDYYGSNTEELERIKEKYDPLGLLSYPKTSR